MTRDSPISKTFGNGTDTHLRDWSAWVTEVHRDHLKEPAPLLPWLNSTEPCEHIFGCARQVVKDFTFLDFIYMLPKLRIKLSEVVLHSQTMDAKASAAGYNHTYFDTTGIDLAVLSHFPSDEEICGSIASAASQEVESLLHLLGINAAQVYLIQSHPHFQKPSKANARPGPPPPLANSTLPSSSTGVIPSISVWYHPDYTPGHVSVSITPQPEPDFLDSGLDLDSDVDCASNYTSSSEDDTGEALQRLIKAEESPPILRPHKIDKRMENLTYAALSVMTDDATRVFEFVETGDDELSRAIQDDVRGVLDMKRSIFELRQNNMIILPALNIGDHITPKHFGTAKKLNLDVLLEIREKNQTNQARTGIQTRFSDVAMPKCLEAQRATREIRREMELALGKYQEIKGVETGAGRENRWRASAPGGRLGIVDGNTAPALPAGSSVNASVVASALATDCQSKREDVFKKAGIHGDYLGWLGNARISLLYPLKLNDYGLVYTKNSLRIGHVIVLYSKAGGKHGNHAAITDSSNISAVSYIGVQLFQYRSNRNFRSHPKETLLLSMKHFGVLPPTRFLMQLDTSSIKRNDDGGIDLDKESFKYFSDLFTMDKQLQAAMKLFSKRAVRG